MWLRNSDYSSDYRPEYNKTYKDTKYNASSSVSLFTGFNTSSYYLLFSRLLLDTVVKLDLSGL